MGDYLRIASAYFNKTTIGVWCFLLVCLLASCASDEFARNPAGILGGVNSRKSYLAMFAYFNACLLGVLLRDNIAHSWASTLPNFRKKHLLVAVLIACLLLALPMFAMTFVGASDVAPFSVAVIFLACLAAGLWTLQHPLMGFLAIPFLAFVMAPSSSFPTLAGFLAGANPTASMVVALISLVALGMLAWRLFALQEGMLEYAVARLWGDLLQGRVPSYRGGAQSFAEYLEALPADRRGSLKNIDPWNTPFNNSRDLDGLSDYRERSFGQRLFLWRLGAAPARTSASVIKLMLTTPFFILPFLYLPSWVGSALPARDSVVIFSVQVMMNPFLVWLFWFTRRNRLSYESLRPRTRPEFVREMGLALFWDIFQCWLGGVFFLMIAGVVWSPELLQWQKILLFSFCTGAGQLCTYAMGIWPVKHGVKASVLCAFGAFLAIALWMTSAMSDNSSALVHIAMATVLAAVSLMVIPLAYGRWCRADLD